MKKLVIGLMLALLSSITFAAERLAIADVNVNSLQNETQVTAPEGADNEVVLFWWVPNEFWEVLLERDPAISEKEKRKMINSFADVSLLMVLQADISAVGGFQFYSKEEVAETLRVTHTDVAGKVTELKPLEKINGELSLMLAIFQPILSNAAGPMGENMHFFVLDDKKGKKRIANPYTGGKLTVTHVMRDGRAMDAELELPLNSLHKARKCPNGKDAHISWQFCPWGGEKLED